MRRYIPADHLTSVKCCDGYRGIKTVLLLVLLETGEITPRLYRAALESI